MTIKERKLWNMHDMRSACIRNNLYTMGSNEEYSEMLMNIEKLYPTLTTIQSIAQNILDHSEDQSLTNIMYIIANEVVKTCFTAYDENGNEMEV